MHSFPLQYLLPHKGINVNVRYASVDIFILDILDISFRTIIFSPIIFFAARITIRAICLHFVGVPLPRSLVFLPPWAGSVSRDLIQSQTTDERWNTKENNWSQNYQGIEGGVYRSKIQGKKCLYI